MRFEFLVDLWVSIQGIFWKLLTNSVSNYQLTLDDFYIDQLNFPHTVVFLLPHNLGYFYVNDDKLSIHTKRTMADKYSLKWDPPTQVSAMEKQDRFNLTVLFFELFNKDLDKLKKEYLQQMVENDSQNFKNLIFSYS